MKVEFPDNVAIELWQLIEDRSGDTDAIVDRLLKYFMEHVQEKESK